MSKAVPKSNRRRSRINYTSHQLQSMEAVFADNQYPDYRSREALSDAIGLTESRIQVWFQNRRARHKHSQKVKKSEGSSRLLRRSPSYEEFSPSSSTSSSRPSSVEPPSPDTCPWSTYSESPSSSHLKIPTVPSPPSSRCREACCSPPAITLSPPSFRFANLSTFSFEDNLWPISDDFLY
ncbi:uncharacterized protein [Amphiura filiformis]|uniref:uncharacterized protein n=1 Tax=Amphiura filiformis TaxID=82378 RepID=UPI003B22835E